MAIVDIEAGSKASSKQLNDNFHYLQDLVGELSLKIDGSEDTVDSKIATLKNTLTNQINDLQTNVNTSIDKLEEDQVNIKTNIDELQDSSLTATYPKWSGSVSVSNGGSAPFDGWLVWRIGVKAIGSRAVKVNGIIVGYGMYSRTDGTGMQSGIVPVNKGDVITWDTSNTNSASFVIYPQKGYENA